MPRQPTPLQLQRRVLRRAVARSGGPSAVAKKLTEIMGEPVKQQHVWNWLHRNRTPLQGKYVIPMEKAVGVSRHELSPDLYPREEQRVS